MTGGGDRCSLTELPRDGCAHCRGDRSRPVPAGDGDYGRPFIARYDGKCSDCGDPFDVGERIVPLLDDRGRLTTSYVHEDCAT